MLLMHFVSIEKIGVVALLLLCSQDIAAAADPLFVLHQSVTQTLSPSGSDVIEVLLSSAQEVVDPQVAVVQVRTPHGELLPHEVFTVEPPPAKIGPAGSRFILRLADSSRFKAAGDYTVTLRLTGIQNRAVQAQLLSLTLTLSKPVFDVARHQNATIRVSRWWPWSAAQTAEDLTFDETGGRSNIADLKVSVQDVFIKGTTELADGTVEVTGDTNGPDGAGHTLAAGGRVTVHLRLAGLDRAGAMTTGLLFASPTLGAPVIVPLNIEVSDRWPFPLIVVALGVALGAWVRHASQVARPREAARFRRSLLAGQVARWRDRSRDPQQIQELDSIDDQLRRSDDRVLLGDIPGATALLDQAESAIAEFRKGWEQRFRTIVNRLRENSMQVDELRERILATDAADRAELETAQQAVNAAQQALTAFDVPAAEARISTALATVEALTARHPKTAPRRGLAPSRAHQVSVDVVESADNRVAGRDLAFNVIDKGAGLGQGDQYQWDFGDGRPTATAAPQTTHRFLSAGTYHVRVGIMRGGQEVFAAASTVDVLARPIELLAAETQKGLLRLTLGLTVVSMVLAVLTAMGLLFFGKSFGTPQQYVETFLWGFGIDSSVKNIADLLKKV